MVPGLRKLFIAVISLAGVLAIYLLYNCISKTPSMGVDAGRELVDSGADGNVVGPDGKIGKIGDVGVVTLQKPRFLHRNSNKEVDREFGFETLLHEEKDRWDIEKPYLNIFQPTFSCYVTADRGKVSVESAAGRPTPKDATFTGNVIFHILPEGSSAVKEGILYLDDVTFLSDRSQFSTAGPVKFVSQDAQMLGRGLELIFNDQLQRLEFLRIMELKNLRMKSSQPSSKTSDEGFILRSSHRQEGTATENGRETKDERRKTSEGEGDYYKCVCSKNVVIDTPRQLVFADKQLTLNNIFWSKAAEKQAAGGRQQTEDANLSMNPQPRIQSRESPRQIVDVVLTCDDGVVITPMDSAAAQGNSGDFEPNVAGVKAPPDFNVPAGRTAFVTHEIDYDASTGETTAGGPSMLTFYATNSAVEANQSVPVKITAQKETKFLPASNQAVFDGNCLCVIPQGNSADRRDCTLSSPTLTVKLPEEKDKGALPDILASGPVGLEFYVEDFGGAEISGRMLPAKVTARKQAGFLAASRQITFEEDCLCVMLREDPNIQDKYILSGQTLIVDLAARHSADLPRDGNDGHTEGAAGIAHLAAIGEVVRLATVKTVRNKLLGGIELKCSRFDYDAQGQLFLAAGPGIIKADNSGAPEPRVSPAGFSLSRPCYAFLQNFDTLRYFSKSNLVVADAGQGKALRIDYIPIIKGKYGEQIVATANHIEANLVKGADGQTELSTLTASGGVTYEDNDNQFAGSQLFYDHNKSIMKVNGDKVQPCYFNGTLVDGIEYNLKTRKVKARVVGPSTLRVK